MTDLERITANTAGVLDDLDSLMYEASNLGPWDMAGKLKLAALAQEKAKQLASMQVEFMRQVCDQFNELGSR